MDEKCCEADKVDALTEAVYQGGHRNDSLAVLTHRVNELYGRDENKHDRITKLEAEDKRERNRMTFWLALAVITSFGSGLFKNWEYVKSLFGL